MKEESDKHDDKFWNALYTKFRAVYETMESVNKAYREAGGAVEGKDLFAIQFEPVMDLWYLHTSGKPSYHS